MLVHCRCGQEFIVHETRFPHRVSCHMCGVKFMVLENGTTDEIRAIPINVNCRCGRPYSLNALQFPRKIHCIDCNHRFSVLDTGEVIDAEVELDTLAAVQSSAISAKGPSEWKAAPVTTIQAELPVGANVSRFLSGDSESLEVSPLHYDPHEDRFRRQLASLDEDWFKLRQSYVVEFLGCIRFQPSRKAALGLLLAILALSAFLSYLATHWVGSGFIGACIFFVLTQVTSWTCIPKMMQKASLHAAGLKKWQKEREALIKLHEAKQEYRAQFQPIWLDEFDG